MRAVGLPVWVLMPQDRKQEGFASRMLPHLQAAYNLARWMLRVPEDAEDAVQEAYMRALRSFGAASGNSDKAWLLAIVRNVCLTRLKRGASRGNVVMLDDVIDQIDMAGHAETDAPDHRLMERDRSAQVHDALSRLPTRFREVIILREFEELSYQEIAAIIDMPVGTVMSRLSRARQKLKSILSALGVEGGKHEL